MAKSSPAKVPTSTVENKPPAPETPDELAFGVAAVLYGFNVPKFDQWLGNLEPCAARERLVELRAKALYAFRTTGPASIRPYLELMHDRVIFIRREAFVLPLARTGKTFMEQGKGRRPGKATVYLRAIKRHGETAKELRKRIKEQPDSNAPVYINERDAMIDKSTGKEIRFKSLEERLNLRKSQ